MSIIPNKDEIEGNYEQAKGKIKEEYGDMTDNAALEAEGQAEQTAGKIQEEYGEVKHDAGDVVQDASENAADSADDFFDRAKGKINEWSEDLKKI